MDGGWKSGSGNAKKDVHSSRQSFDGGTMDAEGRFIPQTQIDQQHFRQTRLRKY